MNYTKKILYQSNYWYNDGLRKAQIRDLSGAVTSLRRSLQYNRANIDARNLLGLVYYGRGEVAEGLVEWIISKNFKPRENIASYFINQVQESPAKLEIVNQSVKNYNQCLAYCEQKGEDLAIIQLKKVIEAHPTFLKAHQLLALLYLHTEQYAKARQILRIARKMDTTNDVTLAYMHEMSNLRGKKVRQDKQKKEETVEYSFGNETIIQPKYQGIKALSGKFTALNIVIGVLIGAAVVGFLIAPALNASKSDKMNKQIVEYSERINAMEAQISAQTRTLNQYRGSGENAEQNAQTAATTADSYENLMTASEQSNSGSYTADAIVDVLFNVNRETLGEGGQALYDSLTTNLFPTACDTLHYSGMESFNVANYETAISSLSKVIRMDEGYDSGGAILNLGLAYQKSGDNENGTSYLRRTIELFPNTENATAAQAVLDSIGQGGEAQPAGETAE